VLDRREAVGDDESRATPHQHLQRGLHRTFDSESSADVARRGSGSARPCRSRAAIAAAGAARPRAACRCGRWARRGRRAS
jgi:hypothetical protein